MCLAGGVERWVSQVVNIEDMTRGHPFWVLLQALLKKCSLDVHDANLMFRRNGDLVLNDPVTGVGA